MQWLRLLIYLLLLAWPAQAGINNPGSSSGGAAPVGKTVLGLNGAATLYLNIAQSTGGGISTQAGWPGALNSNGYPTSSLTSSLGTNDLQFFPNYYGRHKVYWTGTGAFELSTGLGYIVYSGGTSTNINSANGTASFNLALGYFGASTQPTSGSPVEFSNGFLLSAVSDGGSCTGGTAGLVCFTTASANLNNVNTGNTVQINNVTNLSAGPWTITKLDNQHFQLQGSSFNVSMAVVGGSPGTASEAIISVGATGWFFPAQGSNSASYSGMGGMVICRSQNVGIGGLSDCSNIGTHYASFDYVNLIKYPRLNPRWVRFMDQTAVQYSFATSFSFRPTTSQFSWGLFNFVPGYWAGLLTNTSDAFVTASNPTNSPASGGPVDGEVVEGYIGSANITTVPTLAVNRTSFGSGKPILGQSGTGLSLTMSGTVPPTATTISIVFTGGGLASAFTYTYVTSTTVNGPGGVVDTSFSNIAVNIRADINGNVRGNAGALVTAKIVSENPEITGAQMTFGYNPNINSSGVAALGNGLTITGSDSASSGVYNFGYVPVGYLAANHNFTFTYCAICGGWISQDSGINGSSTFLTGPHGGPPLEFYEDLVNQAGVGMWLSIPVLYSDAAINSTAQHICNAGVKELVLEVSNETWNTGGGGQWHPINAIGQYYGFASTFNGGPAQPEYTGLRILQMANAARMGWSTAGCNQSKLFISNAYFFVRGIDPVANQFNGGGLTSSNVTFAAYGGPPSNGTTTPSAPTTCNGGINYATFPCRPIDWSDFISPAPYFTGSQFNSSFGGPINTGVALSAYNCSLVASYNYVNGNASEQTAALNFMFNPSGPSGDFYNTNATLLNNGQQLATWAHGSGNAAADYFGAVTMASAYDATRTGTNPHTSLAWQPVGVAAYEGDQQAGPITAGDVTTISGNLTTLGDTAGYTSGLTAQCGMTPHSGGPSSTVAGDASNMQSLLAGFKNSSNFQSLYTQYFNDFIASATSSGARIAVPATYGFEGNAPTGGTWSKWPGSIYNLPAFKSESAICNYNGVSC